MRRNAILALLLVLALCAAGGALWFATREDPAGTNEALATEKMDPASELVVDAQQAPAPQPVLERAPAESARSANARAAHVQPGLPQVRLPLDGTRSRIAGWIDPPEGRPLEHASVGFFRGSLQALEPNSLAQAECASNGAFQLEFDGSAEGVLVACAPGFTPHVVELKTEAGHELLQEKLELEPGEEIIGGVFADGVGLARAELVAIDTADGVKLALGDKFLKWSRGHVGWAFTLANSDALGRYAIGGLNPGPYRVKISSVRGPKSMLGSSERDAQNVSAPAKDVDFHYETARISISFSCAGQPVPNVEADLTSLGWQVGRRSDAQGECNFTVAPRIECTMVAHRDGYRTLTLPVSAPASGAEQKLAFELEAERPKGSVVFETAATDPLETLTVRGFLNSAPTERAHYEWKVSPKVLASGVHEYTIADVPFGVYALTIDPGEILFVPEVANAPAVTRYCTIEETLVMPETGTVRRAINFTRRGGLRIEARSEHASSVELRLENARGAALPSVIFDPQAGTPVKLANVGGGSVGMLYSTLCAGPVTLLVGPKDHPYLRVPVSLIADQIVPVEINPDQR